MRINDHRSRSADIWDKAQVLSTVLIAIVIGFGSYWIQQSISKESVAKDYVGIATTVLERPKGEQDNDLREWAAKLLNQYSPIKFTPQQQEELKSGGLALTSSGASLREFYESPDGKEEAAIFDIPDGRHVVEVTDLPTGRMISQFEAGAGSGPSKLVWSQDESKLLFGLSRSGTGYLKLFDVARGKVLGEYHTQGPGGMIAGLNFSQDGQSVIITRTDGKSEVWQPPPP